MQAALLAKRVMVHESTCRDQVTRAIANGYVGLHPHRNGGQALPSLIEKEIAMTVKHMREQFYPVFQDDVIKWAAEAIAGTLHESYFPNGKPTRGWYRGWLGRNEFLTGTLRPL